MKKHKTIRIRIKGKHIRVDKGMEKIITSLNKVSTISTLGCCRGFPEKNIPMTIICEIGPNPIILEILSNTIILRRKNFYKWKDGYPFLPEVCNLVGTTAKAKHLNSR